MVDNVCRIVCSRVMDERLQRGFVELRYSASTQRGQSVADPAARLFAGHRRQIHRAKRLHQRVVNVR